MDVAFFGGSETLPLPGGVRRLTDPAALTEKRWELLVLTREGCARLHGAEVACGCGTLLLPDDQGEAVLGCIRAERVIGYGLSPRDSLTMSSLDTAAVLCVQRALPRPDGGTVEPQEVPLPALDLSADDLMAVFGLRLLVEPASELPVDSSQVGHDMENIKIKTSEK